MGSPEFLSIGGEWPAKLDDLRFVMSATQMDDSFNSIFERGVALTEELDRVYADTEPPSPAPTLETEVLRSAVVDTLIGSNLLQRLELGQILTAEFESILETMKSPTQSTEPDTRGGSSLSYNEWAELRVEIGAGSLHAWSHGWNRAQALGLLDDRGELPLVALETKLAHWQKFRPLGVGKATHQVYLAVAEAKRSQLV